jgi:hypothetical protein
MKSKKVKLSAKVFYSVIIALALFLPNMAFAQQWGDFTYTVSGGTVTITKYTGTGGAVVIPASINGMPVVSIGYQAFYNCTGLTSVTIGNSVTSIGSYAFYNCFHLTSVTIPNSVTSIGNYAFQYCGLLTNVTIPNSVTSIGTYAFYHCDSFTSVTIPNSVTSIGDEAFEMCTGLTSIVVEASNIVYSSQDGVLYNKAMTELIKYPNGKSGGFTIPDNVMSIRDYAFHWCTGLTSVIIPNSVTSIGNYAFSDCNHLTSVIIGNSVTSIGREAFAYCWSLTSVTIPDSVMSIGAAAFFDCTGFTSVIIPNGVTSIGGAAFRYCSGLTKAYFLGNAPSMGNDVFANCASNFSICYTAEATGFTTPTWKGYFAGVCNGGTTTVPCNIVWSGTSTDEYGSHPASGSVLTAETSRTEQAAIDLYTAFQFDSGRASFTNNCYGFTLSIPSSIFLKQAVCIDGTYSSQFICYSLDCGGYYANGTWDVVCDNPATTTILTTTTIPSTTTTTAPATVIELSSFTVTPKSNKVILQWLTESEIDNAGFNLYRSEAENGEYTKINTSLIPAQGSSAEGASYEFVDNNVQNRKTYYYKMEDIDLNGTSTYHGPVSATPRLIYGIKN